MKNTLLLYFGIGILVYLWFPEVYTYIGSLESKTKLVGGLLGTIITFYGPLHMLNEIRYQLLKFCGIRTARPDNGRFEADLGPSHEWKTMQEIVHDVNLEERKRGSSKRVRYEEGRHQKRKK